MTGNRLNWQLPEGKVYIDLKKLKVQYDRHKLTHRVYIVEPNCNRCLVDAIASQGLGPQACIPLNRKGASKRSK